MSLLAKLQSRAAQTAVNGVAVLAMVTLLLLPMRHTGYVLAAVALAGVVYVAARDNFAATMPAQIMVTAGLIADYQHNLGRPADPELIATAIAVSALVIAQPTLQVMARPPAIRVTNLPGYRPPHGVVLSPRAFYIANIGLIALLGLAAFTGAPVWPLFVAALVVGTGTAVLCAQALRLRLRGSGEGQAFRSALLAHRPEFAVYFSAPDGTEYHVTMWLPYLVRVGRPFVILVREPKAFAILAAATDVPVVYCPDVSSVDLAVTADMRACFYVNNGAKNAHMRRFSHMTHIQLLHGDSDKASSFNPVTAMFDRVFVAGQAGIDRYASHDVHIPADKFDIVGRPQVESIRVVNRPIAEISTPTVLYATTWVGLYTDANYCSLPVGEKIVAALLARGCRVILRPHPYTDRHNASRQQVARLSQMLAEDAAQSGRQHVYGAEASRTMSLIDCVNAADALISDVSSVATDWLYSRKPFALTNPLGQDQAAFEAEFPLARAAYVVDKAADDVDKVLDSLLGADPLAETRRGTCTYYLGDFAPERYADGFVEAARRYVTADRPAATSAEVTAGAAATAAAVAGTAAAAETAEAEAEPVA